MSASIGRGRRVLIGVVAAMVLIAIGAVPSYGATKQFRLEVTPSSAVAGTSTNFIVKITNTTPGNSAINSFSVGVPFPLTPGIPPQLLPPPDSNNPNAGATVTVVGSQVRVQNIDSLKTSQIIRLRVTATPAALPQGTCSGSAQWSANAYAGNSLNGDQFTNQGTIAQRTTNLLGCLQLQFVTGFAPTDGVINTAMDVQVKAVIGGSTVTTFTGPITIEKVSGPGTLGGNGPVNAIGGVADFPDFQGNATGDYVVKATSPGATESVPPVEFSLFADSLSCEDLQDTLPTGSGGTITIEFLSVCGDVLYTPSFNEGNKELTIEKPGPLTVPLKVTVDAWPPELAPVVDDDLQIPPTLVTPPGLFHPVQWCEGTGPTSWTPPDGESWCLISQNAVNLGPGQGGQLIQVTDEMALFGDAGAKRR